MLLVPQEGPNDPKTFYIMENKVWNKLFQEFAADPDVKTKLNLHGARNSGTIQGAWVHARQRQKPPRSRSCKGLRGAVYWLPKCCHHSGIIWAWDRAEIACRYSA